MNLVPSPVRLLSLALFTLTLTASAAAPPADTQSPSKDPRIGSLIETLNKAKSPTYAAISPDASLVAWSLRGSPAIHLSTVAGANDKPVTTGLRDADCSSSAPTWSPDGDTLAFLSSCTAKSGQPEKDDQEQVFLWSRKTGQTRQLTHLTGDLDSPAWSPDGRSIAFLFVENATRSAGALAAMKPWSGVIGEDGVEIQRIYGVDAATGRGTWISSDKNLHVYEFSWSPDSSRVAYIAANPPGENNWWVAKLYTQTVGYIPECDDDAVKVKMCKSEGAPMGVPAVVLNTATVSGPLHGLQIAVPRWAPDGKQIAFIGGLMSDQGSTGGDIYAIPSTGGEPRDLTPNRLSSPAYFGWINDGTLGIAEHTGGSARITAYHIDARKDDPADTVTFPESIGSGGLSMAVSVAGNGDVAIIRSSFDLAPEVWAGPLKNLKQVSHINDGIQPAWGKTEDINWTNDGFHVQGWLLYPANYDPAKKYPLLVYVHGGPSAATTPRWPGVNYGGVPFSALGYFVFMPNPRGSFGQGEKFTQANVKDFGYGDLRDILTGMDVLEKRFPIDKNREGLTGWSYGGFMTMFTVTQTTRFKAAVAGAGISDWQSYYGENSIDQWMTPFFGKTVYDDPAIYAKSSAIDFIKKVKTPTLVVVGDRDGECPAPQSFEFWHALRAEGVKTQLVVYPNEGHAFHDPDHRRDVLERALNWFETEMPAK